jgi:hypothetical protein
MTKIGVMGGLLILMGALSGEARADIVYSNLGPGDTYQPAVGWTVAGPSAAIAAQEVAGVFTVSGADYVLTSLELALWHIEGDRTITIHLNENSSGLPGAVIESFLVALSPGPEIVTLTSLLTPLLSNGSTYWITTEAGADDTWAAWNWNDQSALGWAVSLDGGASWQSVDTTSPAFRVNGTATNVVVPEPASIISAAVGALGLILVSRRRKAANA